MEESLMKALEEGELYDWTYNQSFQADRDTLCSIIRELLWFIDSECEKGYYEKAMENVKEALED